MRLWVLGFLFYLSWTFLIFYYNNHKFKCWVTWKFLHVRNLIYSCNWEGFFLANSICIHSLQAKDRIQYYQTKEVFVFPYDLGSKWDNFKQVFTWSGNPDGDGLEWPIREGCHQYSLTVCYFPLFFLYTPTIKCEVNALKNWLY